MNKQCLYLAVTNDTIGVPLPLSVGPGFSMPPTVGYGLPAFQPLSTESLILAEDPAALADALVRSTATNLLFYIMLTWPLLLLNSI